MMQAPDNDAPDKPKPSTQIDDKQSPSPILLMFLIMPLVGLFIALIMVATDAQNQQDNQPTFVPAQQVTLINFTAPDFELPMLDGVTLVSPSDFAGRPLFINFWATWCVPCVRELPALEEFVATHADDDSGPVLLTINMGETPEEIMGFLDEIGVQNIPVAMDANQVVKADYGVQNLPTTYIIDEAGMVRFMKLGEMRFEEMGLYLQDLDGLDDET